MLNYNAVLNAVCVGRDEILNTILHLDIIAYHAFLWTATEI